MSNTNQATIYDLITTLHNRTDRKFQAVREQMAAYLGIMEYDRAQFDNKFRRRGRKSNYQLDEVLAIVSAFTSGIPEADRCTPEEAIQLFQLTGMKLDDYGRLREFFDKARYMAAWDAHLRNLSLSPEGSPEPHPDHPRPNKKGLARDASRGNQIFISYSTHDSHFAKKIRRALIAAGYATWLDEVSISSGSTWIDEIKRGISESCAVVVIISANSLKSYWVREEILHVQMHSIPVIPFVIDESPLPFGLQQIKEIHAHKHFDDAIQTLLETLAPCLAKPDKKTNSRQLELLYLSNILHQYEFWKTLYTPLAGIIESLAPAIDNAVETTNIPAELTSDFDLFINEALNDPQNRDFLDDILRLIDQLKQMLILGEAGSGKSTTLQRIAVDFAEKATLSELNPLPVLIKLGTLENDQSIEDKILEELGDLAPWYPELRDAGRLALLLDGLNELPHTNQETLLKEIRSLVERLTAANQFVLLTCRTIDYNIRLDIGMPGRLFIKPLDPIRIRQFIDASVQKAPQSRERLFWTLAGREANHFWDRFVADVGNDFELFWLGDQLPKDKTWGYGNDASRYFYWNQWIEIRNRPNTLLQLARNPYMLFMIVRVFITRGYIPENRARLFQAFVDYVLIHREGLSDLRARKLIQGLADLAFAMQSSTDPSSLNFQAALLHLGDEAALHTARSANILETEDTVRFTHQLLQDYFAAHKLDTEIRKGLSASQIWSPDSWWLPNKWDEVAVLLAGLHPSDTTPIVTWLQDAAPEITSRCVAESGGTTPTQLQSSLAQRWAARLDDMPIPARASIGRALGILGNDPRVGVGLNQEKLPDLDWVQIPDGEFIYGENEKCYLQSFAITRYPVTWIQFQAFINDTEGFYDARWWSGLARREETPGVQSFQYTNHPCERVSWYDAVAFCTWLTHKLGYQVSLPTEYQWEKAARGTEGYIYPYGNQFDPLRGNTHSTGIAKTTAVGLFREGSSPYGLLDMSGNVFEWCLNQAHAPDQIGLAGDERRSLRGGSWAHSAEHSRADYRYSNRPEMRRNRLGFRVVRER